MDSSLYWGESEEGAAPAKRLADNRFHLEGDVILVGREIVCDRFALAVPLLQAVSKFNTVLLSPIPRYLTGGCCQTEGHCSNWAEEGFALQQLQSLEKTRQQLRDCVFRGKNKSVRIMNPVKLFGGGRDLPDTAEALKSVWGNDPVHPAPELYLRIAEELVSELVKIAETREGGDGKRSQSPSWGRTDPKRHKATDGTSLWRGGRGRPFPVRGDRRGCMTHDRSSGGSWPAFRGSHVGGYRGRQSNSGRFRRGH